MAPDYKAINQLTNLRSNRRAPRARRGDVRRRIDGHAIRRCAPPVDDARSHFRRLRRPHHSYDRIRHRGGRSPGFHRTRGIRVRIRDRRGRSRPSRP